VLVLHQLRRLLGNDVFVEAMESFGKQNAGKEVSTYQFRSHLEKASGKTLDRFFISWMETGLPVLQLRYKRVLDPSASENGKSYTVEATVQLPTHALPAQMEVTVETAKGRKSESRRVNSTRVSSSFTRKTLPKDYWWIRML
jgi:aminopeptidase N